MTDQPTVSKQNDKSLLSNIVSGISFKVRQVSETLYKKNLGLSVLSIIHLKHMPKDNVLKKLKLKFGTIWFTSAPDLYHSLIEIFDEKIYLQDLNEHSYILDCGANIGLSVIYLKSICPTAVIEAFEPDAANHELLVKNIAANNLQGITAHRKAVWNENCTLKFVNTGSLSSRLDVDASTGKTVEVAAVRLKDYITKPVDFLKIDIEGAEFSVVKDIESTLHLVKTFFLEYHGTFSQNDELLQLLEIVKRSGFKFYIREAGRVYDSPFYRKDDGVVRIYDVQLNIFCFRV